MMGIRAGDLRHLVQLQSYTASTGDRGQAVRTWATYATVPAMVEELGGRQLELARQLVATATHRITLRYQAALSVKDRVVFGTNTYNIGSVQNLNMMNFTQQLLATSQEAGS